MAESWFTSFLTVLLLTFSPFFWVVLSLSPTATLSWQVNPDPAITLSIDNDIGDVTALTAEGSGSIEVRVSESTTYTLTATDANGSETATVSIAFQAYAELWQIGVDDGSQAEFSQENGTQAAPGSPTVFDDDFYLAGSYPAPVNVVETDEIWENLDRAIANNDPANRIHFNLGALQAAQHGSKSPH